MFAAYRNVSLMLCDGGTLCVVFNVFVLRHHRVCLSEIGVPRSSKICQPQPQLFSIQEFFLCNYAHQHLKKKTKPSVLIQHARASHKAFETVKHTDYSEESSENKKTVSRDYNKCSVMTTEINSTKDPI